MYNCFYQSKKFLGCLMKERKMFKGKFLEEDGENVFFKALATRFRLTSKSCSWFNKVVHGESSIKWTS